jgi:hypothetical protein
MDFLKKDIMIENLAEQKTLQGRGFRQIPEIYKIFHVLVSQMLDKYELRHVIQRVGIISAYEYANLDSNIDFESEIIKYGVSMVNPIKAPFTVCNSCAGWLAIKNKMQNLNLTVSSGRTSIISAIKFATYYINSNTIDYCIILSANLNHGCFQLIEQNDSFVKSEFAFAILLSRESSFSSLYQIQSISVNMLINNDINTYFRSTGNDKTDSYIIFDGVQEINDSTIHIIEQNLSNRYQCCFFPVFLQSKTIITDNTAKSNSTIRYIVSDEAGSIGDLTLKCK